MFENQYRSDHPMDDLDELNQYLNAFACNESDKMIADNAYTNNANYNSSHWQYNNNASLQSSGQYGSDQFWTLNQRPKSAYRPNNDKIDNFMPDYCANGRQYQQQFWHNQQYMDSRFGIDKRFYVKPSEYSTSLESPIFDRGVTLNSTNNYSANEYNKQYVDNNYFVSTKEKQYDTNDSNKLDSDFWNINGIYSMEPDFELLDNNIDSYMTPIISSRPIASSTQSSQSSTYTTTSFYSTDDDQFAPDLVDLLSKDSDESPNKQSVPKSCVETTDSTLTATIKMDDCEDSSKDPIFESVQNIGATEKTETSNDNSLQVMTYVDPISKLSLVTILDPNIEHPMNSNGINGIKDKQRTIRTINKKIAVNVVCRTRRRKSNGTAESIEVKRQRNREAAAKCRKKKLAQIDDLEKQKLGLVTEIGPLEQKVIEMRQKVYEMKKWVFHHQIDGCKVDTSTPRY